MCFLTFPFLVNAIADFLVNVIQTLAVRYKPEKYPLDLYQKIKMQFLKMYYDHDDILSDDKMKLIISIILMIIN